MEIGERTTSDSSYGALAREHRLIERVLDVLRRISDDPTTLAPPYTK